jgi:hypothetical protein
MSANQKRPSRTITVTRVDTDLLRVQRDWLQTIDHEHADGIVNLLDAMLDAADGCASANEEGG